MFFFIDDAASFTTNNVWRQKCKIHQMSALSPKAEDTIVMTGDAASLCLFSVVQNIVDPFEPSVALLLGGDAVADYRLDVLANPLMASAVIASCWLLAGLFSNAYVFGSSLRTTEESLKNVLSTYLLYIPCVTIVLALFSSQGDGVIAAPDFTFCAGAISIIGSWRFTLASTIGR
eukprot:CAMPEP_0194319648 /NCGR_PEP_ID=MMETSP0171-20130528/16085_1 /TAXON_ID=218684 /ORGANISM="Corethron pennatum, Strain L29A3" /LENGTH=174 /DNA_ID=CAMNT_0039076947 /DNA_START=41 /DNA_END=565 /DNA_ORIENTATION=-